MILRRLIIGFLAIYSIQVFGQIDYDKYPLVTSTYFINDVHIQKSPTDSFGIGDILIKDGYISQVAKQLNPPAEAYLIEADSAYAYPGFIAAISHAGIGETPKADKPKVKFRGHPPNAVAGITPEVQASELYKLSENSIKKFREHGFSIAHAVPKGKMLPGQGALLFLDGKENQDLLLRENVSQFLQLKGSGGFYPNTILGVMAKWRDLFRKAHYAGIHKKAFSAQTSKVRPKSDKTIESLIPVTKSVLPIYMKANKPKDIYRGLTLQKELDYKLVLVDVKEGWQQIDKIKERNIPVLLSPVLPKEQKEKKKEKKKSEQEDEETVALKARKKASYENHLAQAAKFEAASIPFGFSMIEADPKDLKKALNRMIEAGLTKAGALAALTTHPAKILGIKNTGKISPGMMANIFISDKPYFDEKSQIKFTFVDGHMQEVEIKKEKKKNGAGGEVSVKTIVGDWSYEVAIPDGASTGTMTIKGTDAIESITITNEDDDQDRSATDIALNGNELSYNFNTDIDGMNVTVNMNLEFEQESFTGSLSIEGFGSFSIEGNKTSSPE